LRDSRNLFVLCGAVSPPGSKQLFPTRYFPSLSSHPFFSPSLFFFISLYRLNAEGCRTVSCSPLSHFLFFCILFPLAKGPLRSFYRRARIFRFDMLPRSPYPLPSFFSLCSSFPLWWVPPAKPPTGNTTPCSPTGSHLIYP